MKQQTQSREIPIEISHLETELDEPCHLIHSDWEYARNISGIAYLSESEEIKRNY